MTLLDTAPCLRATDGSVLALPAHRWFAPADPVDEAVLDRVRGPVLDVGCGPGRHVVALCARGVDALGIDILPAFLSVARTRGATVLEACVFGRLPRTGRWASALLLDGNIGIGGDPSALLARLSELLRPDGRVHVELAPDDDHPRGALVVRAEHRSEPGPWFRWAVVGPRRLDRVARQADWRVVEHFTIGTRTFAELTRR